MGGRLDDARFRERSLAEVLGEGHTTDELHGDERTSAFGTHVIDRDDVRMVQARQGTTGFGAGRADPRT